MRSTKTLPKQTRPRRRSLVVGVNDLATTHPEIAQLAVGWDPAAVMSGSGKKVLFSCPNGHPPSESRIDNRCRAINPTSCPFCVGRAPVVIVGMNDLATTHPHVAKLAIGWDPTPVSAACRDKKLFTCPNGHHHEMAVNQKARTRSGHCSRCQEVVPGVTDLATTHPHIAKLAVGWDPTSVTAWSKRKFLFTCDLGHPPKLFTVSNRINTSGCPYCSNRAVLVGYNDLATTHPHIAELAVGWDPTTLTAHSYTRRLFTCPAGHAPFEMPVGSRSLKGHGCPLCSKAGYNSSKPGWLYLVCNRGADLLQIGISGNMPKRMRNHRLNGFSLIDSIGPLDGELVQQLELDVKREVRRLRGGERGALLFGERFDGWTESWPTQDFPVSSMQELLRVCSPYFVLPVP